MPDNNRDSENSAPSPPPEDQVEEEVVWRHLRGADRYIFLGIAIAWSSFQLLIASRWLVLDAIYVRSAHLAFALLLIFLGRPLLKKPRFGPRSKFLARADRIGLLDWPLAALAALLALYIIIDREGIIVRLGDPAPRDIVVGLLLLVVLLEGCRRAIGPALSVIALFFCAYAFFGSSMPGDLAFKSVSLRRLIGQMSMESEGIYGIPLGVSASVVFLFVLFGSMLERAGGGRYFTQLAMSLLGGFRGGPAKAAVLSSGLTGMVSGSSIANIVTTGTFTIPMMKKVGYPATKAAAIEVAASTDGQLAPPIMGAAAFIIAEYIPGAVYLDVIKAAAIPAFASYAALLYITHVEACKLGLKRIPRSELPAFGKVLVSGLHFLIPLAFLIWQLVVLRRTPEKAAFIACLAMAAIMLAQHPLRAYFGRRPLTPAFRQGAYDILASLASGARNMVPVALATAGAGVIVGVVSLGPGGLVTEVIDKVSMGNIYIMLFITALASLLIGIGLPTTATYVTMATLTAPVIVAIAGRHELVVPLMAAHLFVFYFGILADDTPPVGLAAYAAAAIAKSPPIATGIQGFLYDIRTAILPFMFIFNTDLILHNVDNWPQGLLIFAMACVGNCAFVAATQGWFTTRNRWYELLLLLAVTFIMMRPDAVARWLTLPHSERYWAYPLGLGLFASIYLIQRLRVGRARRAQPTGA
ncbi:TRAP transporter permease [Candidatus Sumerlaeota bacterium]